MREREKLLYMMKDSMLYHVFFSPLISLRKDEIQESNKYISKFSLILEHIDQQFRHAQQLHWVYI